MIENEDWHSRTIRILIVNYLRMCSPGGKTLTKIHDYVESVTPMGKSYSYIKENVYWLQDKGFITATQYYQTHLYTSNESSSKY